MIDGFIAILWADVIFLSVSIGEPLLADHLPLVHDFGIHWTERLLGLFNSTYTVEIDKFTSFMAGVSSISGVFLGLYFTAISIGVGQQLGNLSQDLRRLIVHEKTGTRYVQLLTVLTALTLLFWFNASVLGNYSLLSITVVLLFVLFLIGAFYPLGQRSFFLADPPSLAIPIFLEIRKSLKKLKKWDAFFGYPAFQAHYREVVTRQMGSFSEVLDLALEKGAKDKRHISILFQNLFNQYMLYHLFKHSISKDSQWFQRIPQHDNWLYQNETKVKMLKSFGAITEPQMIPDVGWFEKLVVSQVVAAMSFFKKEKDVDGIVAILSVFRNYVIVLAASWDIEEARKSYRKIQSNLKGLIEDESLELSKRLEVTELLAILGWTLFSRFYRGL